MCRLSLCYELFLAIIKPTRITLNDVPHLCCDLISLRGHFIAHFNYVVAFNEGCLKAHLQNTGHVNKMLGWYRYYPALSEGRCTAPSNAGV